MRIETLCFYFDPLSFVCHLLANKIVNFVFCPLTGATRGPRMKYENKINLFPPGWAGRCPNGRYTGPGGCYLSGLSFTFFRCNELP